jgi:hypothetical protein
MNSAIGLIWSRHTLHEPNSPLCGNNVNRPRQALRVAERAGELIAAFSDEISKFLAESAKNELR